MPRSMAAMHSLTALNVSFNQLEEIDQVRGLRQCSARQTIFYNKHVLKQHSAYLFKVVWQGMSCIRALISLKMDNNFVTAIPPYIEGDATYLVLVPCLSSVRIKVR
jgi:hypothetical protein